MDIRNTYKKNDKVSGAKFIIFHYFSALFGKIFLKKCVCLTFGIVEKKVTNQD